MTSKSTITPGGASLHTWFIGALALYIDHPSKAVWRADIYRKIGSFKVLEHFLLTPR